MCSPPPSCGLFACFKGPFSCFGSSQVFSTAKKKDQKKTNARWADPKGDPIYPSQSARQQVWETEHGNVNNSATVVNTGCRHTVFVVLARGGGGVTLFTEGNPSLWPSFRQSTSLLSSSREHASTNHDTAPCVASSFSFPDTLPSALVMHLTPVLCMCATRQPSVPTV